MEWKSTEEEPEFTEGTIDDDADESEYPVWEKQKKFSVSETLSKKIEIPFILMAAGLVLVIAVFFISMSGEEKSIDVSRIDAIEQRLGGIEERLIKLEAINTRTEGMGEQNKALDALKLKISKLETDATARMDQLSSDLSKLTKKMLAVEHITPAAEKNASGGESSARTVYHQVQSGDTLYGIGRQYDVSVEELRKMNNLSPGKVIYPGQKLIVGTAKSR